MEVATAFFHACEQGRGWSGCSSYCVDEGTFTVQAMDALPGPAITLCKTLEQYTEWMKGVCENMGEKATYEVNASAYDETTGNAIFFFTFGGLSHNVYIIKVKDAKVVSLTKVWNDSYAFKVMSS